MALIGPSDVDACIAHAIKRELKRTSSGAAKRILARPDGDVYGGNMVTQIESDFVQWLFGSCAQALASEFPLLQHLFANGGKLGMSFSVREKIFAHISNSITDAL